MKGYDRWEFPHESLKVYQDSLEFLRWVHGLQWPHGSGELKRQLTRAATSITLTICEGRNQKYAGNQGDNFYRIALGSAGECHGVLEVREIVRGSSQDAGIRVLRRIGARLSGLLTSG